MPDHTADFTEPGLIAAIQSGNYFSQLPEVEQYFHNASDERLTQGAFADLVRAIARRYTVWEASRFMRCVFWGRQCSEMDTLRPRNRGAAAADTFVSLSLDLFSAAPWAIEEAEADRGFWSGESAKNLPAPVRQFGARWCLMLGFCADCSHAGDKPAIFGAKEICEKFSIDRDCISPLSPLSTEQLKPRKYVKNTWRFLARPYVSSTPKTEDLRESPFLYHVGEVWQRKASRDKLPAADDYARWAFGLAVQRDPYNIAASSTLMRMLKANGSSKTDLQTVWRHTDKLWDGPSALVLPFRNGVVWSPRSILGKLTLRPLHYRALGGADAATIEEMKNLLLEAAPASPNAPGAPKQNGLFTPLRVNTSYVHLIQGIQFADPALLDRAGSIATSIGAKGTAKAIQRLGRRITELKLSKGNYRIAIMREGDTVLKGVSLEGFQRIQVTSKGPCHPLPGNDTTSLIGVNYLRAKTEEKSTQVFDIPLYRPLRAGECIAVEAISPDGHSSPVGNKSYEVTSGSSDWGRMRLYGRMGAEVFARSIQTAPEFSGALNFDFALKALDIHRSKSFSMGAQLYLEGRLEAISSTDLLVGPKGKDGKLDCTISGSRMGANCSISPQPSAGRVGEAGLYLPILMSGSRRTFRGSELGLTIGPLFKTGIQGQSGTHYPGYESSFDYYGPRLSKGLGAGPYTYRATGLRFGWMRLFAQEATGVHANETAQGKSRNRLLNRTSPILLSHVDVLFGTWDNFSLPTWDNFSLPMQTRHPLRVEIRGNLAIPNTPFFAGLFWNTGLAPFDAGPSDRRYFFGLRTEFAQMTTVFRRNRILSKLFYEAP